MGQDLQSRVPETPSPRPEPSWAAVAGNTVRLWLERHHIISYRPASRRKRLIIALAALVAAIVANPMLNGEVIRLDGAIRMAPR